MLYYEEDDTLYTICSIKKWRKSNTIIIGIAIGTYLLILGVISIYIDSSYSTVIGYVLIFVSIFFFSGVAYALLTDSPVIAIDLKEDKLVLKTKKKIRDIPYENFQNAHLNIGFSNIFKEFTLDFNEFMLEDGYVKLLSFLENTPKSKINKSTMVFTFYKHTDFKPMLILNFDLSTISVEDIENLIRDWQGKYYAYVTKNKKIEGVMNKI